MLPTSVHFPLPLPKPAYIHQPQPTPPPGKELNKGGAGFNIFLSQLNNDVMWLSTPTHPSTLHLPLPMLVADRLLAPLRLEHSSTRSRPSPSPPPFLTRHPKGLSHYDRNRELFFLPMLKLNRSRSGGFSNLPLSGGVGGGPVIEDVEADLEARTSLLRPSGVVMDLIGELG